VTEFRKFTTYYTCENSTKAINKKGIIQKVKFAYAFICALGMAMERDTAIELNSD
jgi:hypothetical protein